MDHQILHLDPSIFLFILSEQSCWTSEPPSIWASRAHVVGDRVKSEPNVLSCVNKMTFDVLHAKKEEYTAVFGGSGDRKHRHDE